MSSNKKRDGISLRTIHLYLIVGAAVISCLMLYATYDLSTSFRRLTETSERQIELRKAALELMDASDYLTEMAQRFSVLGEARFADEYFSEATEARRREEAIERMSSEAGSAAALEQLEAAMDASVRLMNREYYAMRLVVEAQGMAEYPRALDSAALSDEDRALPADEKMRLAARMLHDDAYYGQKDIIRQKMRASLDALERMAYDGHASALDTLRGEMGWVRAVIALQAVGIVGMVWLTSRLGIHPVLNAVERIKADSPIPEVGANEFRYLARAYNKMYEVYRASLERLNFKASHDELTGAYNRAGYELLLSSIDLRTTYMLLFDVDNFKVINDTCGHETGDRALKKITRVLKANFRAEDYVCRIGGDEFVVFVVHSNRMKRQLLAQKIEKINRELEEAGDGLPSISVSVGIVHGEEAADAQNLFEKTDAAMYRAKQNGKHTYRFYAD